MGATGHTDTALNDKFSEIAEKGEVGFIDYENDNSVCSYNPRDEGHVLISVPFPFVRGKPQSVFKGETSKCSITLQNTSSESVELWGTRIYCSNPGDSFTLSLSEPPLANSSEKHIRGFLEGFSLEDRVLQPYSTLTIWLSCKPKDIGLHTTVVHFDVGDDRIERVVLLLAEDKISLSLASNYMYSRSKQTNVRKPKDASIMLETKQVPEVISRDLTRANYSAYFTALISMAELHLKEEIGSYDMAHVEMMRRGNYLALEVPGLAEKRPSPDNGDFVFARLASQSSNLWSYMGRIHRVKADEVLLKFAPGFHRSHQNKDLYDIRFTFNRVGRENLYQAVDEAAKLENAILFPSQANTSPRLITPSPIVPHTCNINEEQLHAVEMILGCKGSPPYVIYGPPGTGKTSTLVEAILQLYATRGGSRILVCAASNSAADHIFDKLVCNNKVKNSEVLRLNAPNRHFSARMHTRRIIIATYMSTCLLQQQGIYCGHFSHIFIDDAGQASEPETMIPLAHLCKKKTVVVLAGDPTQLGSDVLLRSVPESSQLTKSYLERLLESEFYHSEDDNYVVKLVRNYRCHPAILDLPSKLIYGGDLLPCKEDADSSCSDLSFDFLPNKEFPVVFFGIQGCDERDGNDPSWFNRFEASKVVEIVRKLMKNSDLDRLTDIGIITPYCKQVEKLSKVLENKCMEGVKVGTVEEFQGQEREVIIVSTVRSTVKHNDYDKRFCLGFLGNPRMFNAVITRARSLLIIVGNPHILSEDPYWDKLLWYCVDNNSYLGCSLPKRKYFEDEICKP